jgi:hypothetical protein
MGGGMPRFTLLQKSAALNKKPSYAQNPMPENDENLWTT